MYKAETFEELFKKKLNNSGISQSTTMMQKKI